MKAILFFTAFLLAPFFAGAQFIAQGKITYERKTSLRRQMQTSEASNEWVKSMIDKIAQYTISDFVMFFSREGTEYEFVKEQEVAGETLSWGPKPCRENKVYVDFNTGRITAQKDVYENKYLVSDELPRYQWKIESEMREIAGYSCRKAVTRICDSVVVVAFYTDQILVSGGPESFSGLPGMILGLAVPRLYTTWFATQVEPLPQEVAPFRPERKSRKVNQAELMAEVGRSTKSWGVYGTSLAWWLAL